MVLQMDGRSIHRLQGIQDISKRIALLCCCTGQFTVQGELLCGELMNCLILFLFSNFLSALIFTVCIFLQSINSILVTAGWKTITGTFMRIGSNFSFTFRLCG